MNFQSNVIKLHFELPKPIRILHITDVHLSLADDMDGDDMREHAALRRNTFFKEGGFPERDPIGYFENAMEYSQSFDCTVITGDVLDFTSHANCEIAKKILAGKDYLFCAGNHEFCPKVGIPDSFDRKNEIFDDIQSVFRGNMDFESRIVGGVNVIALDNSYFIWTEAQFEKLQREVSRGLPCILFCHTPITHKHMRHDPHHKDLAVSDEVVEFTRKVSDYIINEEGIKAVFSGHLHKNSEENLGDKRGYVLGGLFKGIIGEIVID